MPSLLFESFRETLVSVVQRAYTSLADKGWAKVEFDVGSPLTELVHNFGRPISSLRGGQLVDQLTLRSSAEAQPRSLSGHFGKGAFPFHTDLAHHRTPPRYVLIRLLKGDHVRPTVLLDFERVRLARQAELVLRRSVWLVNGGRGRFSTSILRTQSAGKRMVRYDPVCMAPAHESFAEAAGLLQDICDSESPCECTWEHGWVLVMDNWRVLHARPSARDNEDDDRALERVQVAV